MQPAANAGHDVPPVIEGQPRVVEQAEEVRDEAADLGSKYWSLSTCPPSPTRNLMSLPGLVAHRIEGSRSIHESIHICPSGGHKFILDFFKIPGYFRGIKKPWSISP